jgi:hypothetical protein
LAVKSWVSSTKYSSGVAAKPGTFTQNFKDFEPLWWGTFAVGSFVNGFYQNKFSSYFESSPGLEALITGPLSSEQDARNKAGAMAAIVKKGPFWGSIDAVCTGTAALAHAYIRYAESTMKERAHNHYQRLQNGTV